MAYYDADMYPAEFDIDYPEGRDRLNVLLRLILSIPILIIIVLIVGLYATGTLGIILGTALMILFRKKYPRWWFDFVLELTRFQARMSAYISLLTDKYPSTDEEQSVHLELDYPDAEQLNRFLPLVKWILLIPHYIVILLLFVLSLGALAIAWYAILFTNRYPRPLFDFIVGVTRYWLRVTAYGFMLITDRYPPFRLGP